MNASKKGPLEAGLRVLGDSNSAIACQLGAALLWRITSAARWRIRGSGKIGESTGKIGADDGNPRRCRDIGVLLFDRALPERAGLRLNMQRAPLTRADATSRRHHANPAEAHKALAGERSEAIRLNVRGHHRRSLCGKSPAQSEQWCCSIGRRPIISRGTRPELRIPNVAAHTGTVSGARIRLDSRKSVRAFKGIFCDDISEIAVGTLITERPPHRAERAPFGHSAPTSGI